MVFPDTVVGCRPSFSPVNAASPICSTMLIEPNRAIIARLIASPGRGGTDFVLMYTRIGAGT